MFRKAQQAAPSRPGRTLRALLCATAVTGSLLCAPGSPVQAAPRPPNPSDAQLAAARSAKASLAHTVGVLSGQIVQAQAALRSLDARLALAEQKFAFAMFKLDKAKTQAAQAQAGVLAAQKGVQAARARLTAYVHDSYVSPPLGSSTAGLLSASDPNALLQGGDYRHYVSSRHLDAMSGLDRATVARSNAEAKAKSLVALQKELTEAAEAAQRAAQQAYADQKAQAAQLRTREAAYQRQLLAAQTQLAELNGQRAKFVAYQQEQARIAAEKARQAAEARARAAAAAAAARAEQERQQRAERERREQQERQEQQNNNSGNGGVTNGGSSDNGGSNHGGSNNNGGNNNNGGSNNGGSNGGSSSGNNNGGGYTSPPPATSTGNWTASKGQAAANRALSQLGVPYSWAGGGYNGPTWGVNSPGTAGANDSGVFGFDCSGLMMYAWAPQGIYMDHFAASQYYAGSVHPQPGQFLPGDLLFWSEGGIGDIHHVALYIGGGNVVHAPHSGDVVRVAPWDQMGATYLGATRPLT